MSIDRDQGPTPENGHSPVNAGLPVDALSRLATLENGLSDIGEERLREYVDPIWTALEKLDAQELLKLETLSSSKATSATSPGAILRPG